MPLFAIWRELDPAMTASERDAMTIRSIGALEWFPNVRWIRSFVIEEPGRLETLCAYEATSVEELRATNLRCAVPFVEIRPVVELLPDSSAATPDDGDFYLVSRRSVAGTAPGAGWVRSYVDEERSTSTAIYRWAAKPSSAGPELGVESITAVTEILPSNWSWAYESLNVPKHWELDPAKS